MTRACERTVEHCAAPGLDDVEIELADDGEGPALRLRHTVTDEATPEGQTTEQRIVETPAETGTPPAHQQIRKRAVTRAAAIAAALQTLIREGRIERDPQGGYRLAGWRAETAPPAAAVNGKRHETPLPNPVSASNPSGGRDAEAGNTPRHPIAKPPQSLGPWP